LPAAGRRFTAEALRTQRQHREITNTSVILCALCSSAVNLIFNFIYTPQKDTPSIANILVSLEGEEF